MLYIKETEVGRLITMPEAIHAVEDAFQRLGQRSAVNIPRSRVRLPGHTLHVMSGGIPGIKLTGLKAYTTTRYGAQFVVLLFHADNCDLQARIDDCQCCCHHCLPLVPALKSSLCKLFL